MKSLFLSLILFPIFANAALPHTFDGLKLTAGMTINKSTAISSKSLLEIQSTTKGMLIPRMTTAQKNAIASPDEGLLVWDTDLNTLAQYDGAAWQNMSTLAGVETLTNKSLTTPTLTQPTIMGFAKMEEQSSTPSTPASGYKLLYPKNDGKLYTLNSSGSETEVGSGSGGSGAYNLLTNGGFESGTTGWSTSGASVTTSTSNPLFDTTSGIWDATATSQYVETSATVLDGLAGNNCMEQFYYTGGDANLTAYVTDGSNNTISGQSQVLAATTTATPVTFNFICPAAGSTLKLRVVSSADAASIKIDKAHIGLPDNLSSIQQGGFYGSLTYAGTINCAWTSTATTSTAYAADTDCPTPTVTGNVTAPATKIPGFVISAPGRYFVQATGARFTTSSATNGAFTAKLSDGTISSNTYEAIIVAASGHTESNAVNLNLTFTKTDNASSTFNIYTDTANGTLSLHNIGDSLDGQGLNFQVWRYPLTSEQAVNARNTNYERTGYTPTFTNFGTATNVNCTHKRDAQDVLINCFFTTGTAVAGEARVSLPTGLTSLSTLPALTTVGEFWGATTTSTGHTNTGSVLIEPSQTYVTFSAPSSTTLSKANGSAFTNSTSFTFTARVPIQGWGENQKAPILVGGLTTPSTGAEIHVGATVNSTCSSSPCTIAAQSGGITDITRSGTGQYSVNFIAGTFSVAPRCVAMCNNTSNCQIYRKAANTTTSAMTFSTYTVNTAATLQDGSFDVECTGAK